jgi:hypothetical protein
VFVDEKGVSVSVRRETHEGMEEGSGSGCLTEGVVAICKRKDSCPECVSEDRVHVA